MNYLLFVYTRPVEGMEAEYDEWYNTHHLKDVLALDGFHAAQRWVYSHPHPAEEGETPEWRHVALYEVDEENYDRARASITESALEREEALAEGRTPMVPLSPALADYRVAYWFAENSPRLMEG